MVDVDGLVEVEATSGALMLLPRTVFEQLGGFDEGYVLHCEDLDLCRRVLDAGWRIAVDTSVPVTHLKGTSAAAVRSGWNGRSIAACGAIPASTRHQPWWLRLLVPLGIAAHFRWRPCAHGGRAAVERLDRARVKPTPAFRNVVPRAWHQRPADDRRHRPA